MPYNLDEPLLQSHGPPPAEMPPPAYDHPPMPPGPGHAGAYPPYSPHPADPTSPYGSPQYAVRVHSNPALLGVVYSPELQRNIWAPERVPYSNFLDYREYYETPLPEPPLIQNFDRKLPIIACILFPAIGLALLLIGALQTPTDLAWIVMGAISIVAGPSLALFALIRLHKTKAAYKRHLQYEQEALACVKTGRMPPLPPVPVCKFCSLTDTGIDRHMAVCSWSTGLGTPPVLACINSLGQEHQSLVMDLLLRQRKS